MDSSLGQRFVVEAPEFDSNAYRKTVLSGLLSSGVVLDDPFLLIGLGADDPAADDSAALRDRIAEVFGFWQREHSSPRYKGLVAELLRHRNEIENVLLDPINRREARARLATTKTQSDSRRKGHIAALVKAVAQRHSGVPRSRLILLQRLAQREGMPAAELEEIVSAHRIIEDGGGVDPLTVPVRRMIRAALDELRLRGDKTHSGSLWAYLDLTTAAEDDALLERYTALAEENQRRAFDRDKTVHADVLALVKEHLLTPQARGRALASLLLDAREAVQDRVLEQALVDTELYPADVDHLVAALLDEGMGLSPSQARAVVRQAATASGIAVTTGGAVCPTCTPAAKAPAPQKRAGGTHRSVKAEMPPTAAFTVPTKTATAPSLPDQPMPAKGSAEDEWRQAEREVSLRRVVAASLRLAKLARSHPDSHGPSGQTPVERHRELALILTRARVAVDKAMSLSDPVQRELAVYAVLETVADLTEVQDALGSLPLPGVEAITVDVAGGKASLSWRASSSSRTVTYAVTRIVRSGDGKKVEHRVGTTTDTVIVDADLPGVGIVSWEVVAQAAGRRSIAVETEARPLVPEVTALRAATGSAGITLSWRDTIGQDPQAAIIVERSVMAPSDGPLRRTRVTGTRWTDADVRGGVVYRYVVRVERAVDGIVARTPGCTVDVSIGDQPVPIIDLAATVDGDAVRLRWKAGKGVTVAIMASDVPLGPIGEDLDLEVFERIARRVDGAAGSGEVVDHPRSAVTIYTPVTEHGNRGLLGQAVRHVGLNPVSDLQAEDTGRVVTLKWNFPRGCTRASIGWRRDRPPVEVHDVEQAMVVTADEVKARGWQIAAPKDDGRPWYFVVSPIAVLPGEDVHGPGSVVALRT